MIYTVLGEGDSLYKMIDHFYTQAWGESLRLCAFPHVAGIAFHALTAQGYVSELHPDQRGSKESFYRQQGEALGTLLALPSAA